MSNTRSCSGQKQASALAQSILFQSGAGSARQGRWAVAKIQRVPRRSVPDPETLSPLRSASLSADYHARTSDFSAMPAQSKPSSLNFLSACRWKADPCSSFNEVFCWVMKRTRAALLPDQTGDPRDGLGTARTNSCRVRAGSGALGDGPVVSSEAPRYLSLCTNRSQVCARSI